jgi:hypothetical protein
MIWWQVNDELERTWKEAVVANFKIIIINGATAQSGPCPSWFSTSIHLCTVLSPPSFSNSVFGNYLLSQHPSISSLASKHLTSHHHPGYSLTLQTIRYYPDIPLQGLGKPLKMWVRIAGLRAETWTRDLPNWRSVNHSTTMFDIYSYITWRVNNRPVDGRSSET